MKQLAGIKSDWPQYCKASASHSEVDHKVGWQAVYLSLLKKKKKKNGFTLFFVQDLTSE